MAKGNLFLGQARGKVGSVVFSRAFGEQITRTRPTSVANPKTIGQNTQRAILATVAKAAAAMTPLVDHSFANVTYGAESVRHFRKVNMGLLRNLYLNTQNDANLVAKGGLFMPSAFKISEGSLASFYASVDDDTIAFSQTAGTYLPAEGGVYVRDFTDAYPFLQGGDQLTLVKIIRLDGSMEDGDGIFTMSLDRMVFAPNAFDNPDAIIIEDGETEILGDFLDLTKTTNIAMLTSVDGGAGHALGFTDENCVYAALILSRKVNNKWQRSTQFLEKIDYNDHADNEAAIDSYGNTASLAEDTEYLNQADDSDIRSGVNGAYMNVSYTPDAGDTTVEKVDAGDSSSANIAVNSGVKVSLGAQAFAPAGKRVVAVEIDNPNGSYAAHGSKSVLYDVVVTADTAGAWKAVALFDDGTRAVFTFNLSVQA